MFAFRCICLLSIISAYIVRCELIHQFAAKNKINLGSTITIDASQPTVDELTFYGEFLINPYTINTISVHNFTDTNEYGFGVLQVHSCWYNLTLSFNKTIEPNFNANGTNLGFTLYPTAQNRSQDIHLHNYNYFTSVNVSVALILYNRTTPEPGGCNMEYPIANAPMLIVSFRKEYISIDTPLAAARADEPNEVRRCNVSLTYTGYHFYLERGDYTCRSLFDGIRRLMTIDRIKDNGILGSSVPGSVAIRRRYSAIPGTGIVFQTIVSGTDGMSSYVPSISISCSPALWESSCNIFDTATYHVMAGILILIGILRAYFGDILKTVGVFIDGFIFGLLVVFYIIYLSDSTVNEDKAQQFLIVGAFLIAILITILFICFDVLYNSFTLLSNIIAGYLLGAFIVYYIDDYFYEFKSYGWMYETVFIGSILAVMIILAPCQSLGPIMLSATCGTFYIVQGLCYMHGNHMNYVILNALRYTSIEDFRKVHSTPATNIEDFWFLFLWLALCISAVLFQLELHRHRLHLNATAQERLPLISRMTHGSDDVFESPVSNMKFLERFHRRRNQW